MRSIFTFLFLVISVAYLYSQPNYILDNGNLTGYFANEAQISWEETILLQPPGPGYVDSIYVYWGGETAGSDTLYLVGDPAEGSYPPSMFCRYINSYEAFIFNYSEPGWYAFGVRDANIYIGGINRLGVQHNIDPTGPYFGIDNNGQNTTGSRYYRSFVNNVYQPNPQFYNIRGAMASAAPGDFMVRLKIDYDYPDGEGGSLSAPEPTLVDVTTEVGLQGLKSDMLSVVDWNNDGFDDIAVRNRFFQNTGKGTFEEIDFIASNNPFATVWADADNDGNIDFFAARGSTNDRIYWGNGDGTFTEETSDAIKLDVPTVTPLWLDYNGDGLLDLFVANGRRTIDGSEVYYQDRLFKNLGNREFEDVTQEAGIVSAEVNASNVYQEMDTWGASITDYNNDGWPDIFVATYRLAPDLLLRNNKDGTFTNVANENGAMGAETYNSNYFGHGMGSDWGDFDNDGDLDLAVGNLAHWDDRALASNKSLILRNDLNQDKFTDVTDTLDLKFFEMNAGIMWVDLNNDGLLDLVHSQYSYDNFTNDAVKRYSRFYINQGEEEDFFMKDVTWQTGAYIHGAWTSSRIDFDNDGDMDVIMASAKENVKLYRNDISNNEKSFKFLPIALAEGNERIAFGTSAEVTLDNGEKLYRSLPGIVSTGRASQSTNILHFGLGEEREIESVKVMNQMYGFEQIISKEDIAGYENGGVLETSIPLPPTSVLTNERYSELETSPNPFNNELSISVKSDINEKVEIKVYDLNGNVIDVLFTGYLQIGNTEFNWLPNDVNSGTYIISVKGDKINKNQKVIYSK